MRVCVHCMYERVGSRWVLWYYKNDKARDWKDNIKRIINFDTVCWNSLLIFQYFCVCTLCNAHLHRAHRLRTFGGKLCNCHVPQVMV